MLYLTIWCVPEFFGVSNLPAIYIFLFFMTWSSNSVIKRCCFRAQGLCLFHFTNLDSLLFSVCSIQLFYVRLNLFFLWLKLYANPLHGFHSDFFFPHFLTSLAFSNVNCLSLSLFCLLSNHWKHTNKIYTSLKYTDSLRQGGADLFCYTACDI